MRHLPSFALLISVLISSQGCKVLKIPADPPEDDVRSQLGRIRIEVVSKEADPDITHPPSGCCEGFCKGMAHGAEILLPDGPQDGNVGGIVLLVPMPITAMVFGFITMFRSTPTDITEELEKPIRAAFEETPLCRELQSRLWAEARSRWNYHVLGPEEEGAADTVMRVEIDQKLLYLPNVPKMRKMKMFLDPPLAVYVRAHVRLIRSVDGAVVYEGLFRHESPRRTFGEWNRDNGQGVRAELSIVPECLARDAAYTLFGASPD